MTPLAAIGMTPAGPTQSGPATAADSAPGAKTTDPRVTKAARDFEAIFVRQMLHSLEKTTSLGTGKAAAGASTYGAMCVNAMADAVSGAGGLGLSSVLVKHFAQAHPDTGQAAGGPTLAPKILSTP